MLPMQGLGVERMDGTTAIIIAAITAVGGITAAATTGVLRIKELSLRLEQANHEIRFQRDALDVASFIGDWDGLINELKSLMAITSIDRFLILRAWNGHLEPRWTSAIFQLRADAEQMISYIHVELDQDYVERLRRITTAGPVVFSTADVDQNALIRGIYETEGVAEAMWAHIETLSVPGTATKAVTYCSFATAIPGGLDAAARTRANLIIGRLKGLASGFSNSLADGV
jgi:hypothetical protein